MVTFGSLGISGLQKKSHHRLRMPKSSVRMSNFEFLRVMSMMLIVAHHYLLKTNWGRFETLRITTLEDGTQIEEVEKMRFNQVFTIFLGTGGKIGVNTFLIISGYFLNGRVAKPAVIVKTWVQTCLWSWIIFLLECLRRPMWYQDYMIGIFPVFWFHYWFSSMFIVTMLASAGIVASIIHTTPWQAVGVLMANFVIMGLLPWETYSAYSNFSWFSFMLQVGIAIRRFESSLRKIPSNLLALSILMLTAINAYSVYSFTLYPVPWSDQRGGGMALMKENNSIVASLLAASIFVLVMRLEFTSPTINFLASTSYGVYLIHENFFFSGDLWNVIVRGMDYETSSFYPLISVSMILLVYATCSLLEYGRILLFGRLEKKMVDLGVSICQYVGDKITSDDSGINVTSEQMRLPKEIV